MRKLLLILLVVLIIAPGIFAGGQKEANEGNDGQVVVGMVLKTLSSQYWKIVAAGAQEAADKAGVKLILQGPASEDMVEQQVNMIQDVLEQNPDFIAISPSQPPTVIPLVEKAKERGIPVLVIDTRLPDGYTNYDAFIGTTNIEGGRQGGKYLASLLKKGDKVALLLGAPGNPSTTDRVTGAKESLEAAGMKIAAVQPAYSDREKGFTVMQNILQANPDIAGVFSSNDEMALGALRALQGAGKGDVPVIGFDAISDAAQSIINGEMAASVAQAPYDMGRLGVELGIKIINGEKVEKEIDSGTSMITPENAAKHLEFLKSME